LVKVVLDLEDVVLDLEDVVLDLEEVVLDLEEVVLDSEEVSLLIFEDLIVDLLSFDSRLQDFNLELCELQDSFEDLDFTDESDDVLDILFSE
jgi:hypothetical protein